MAMKWRKAEQYEISNYHGVYPLCAYVSGVTATLNGVKTTYTVAVERCTQMSPEDPRYEAIMPEGMHMADDPLHTLLGFSQRDLLGRLSAGMVECERGKTCG